MRKIFFLMLSKCAGSIQILLKIPTNFFSLQTMTKLMLSLCSVVTGKIGGAPWGSKSRCGGHLGI